MGALDPQGIFKYDDTENWSPQDDYQNLLANSVSTTVADIRAEIADLELLADSGWVPITTLGPGWTAYPGHPPRVRKVGDRVDIAGELAFNAGADTNNMLTLPAGYWPSGTYTATFLGSGVTNKGTAFVYITAAAYPGRIYIPGGHATKNFVAVEAVPLLGSWYIS